MGALFSELCGEAKRRGVSLGAALASNTSGAALAPALFGVWLVPVLGSKGALLSVVAGYFALVPPRAWLSTHRFRAAAAALALGVGALVWAAPFAAARVPEGGRLIRFEEGVGAAVSVLEDASGVQTLHINGRAQEGSNATLLADARQAWLPLLLVPEARRALFLGLGTGVTAGAAAWDAELHVDVVELLPEVVAASASFAAVLGSPLAPRVIVSDARRYVRAQGPRYDVVVADLFHPARSGAGALYSVEHFAAVRGRLAPGGVFCQWLPLHQLDSSTLRSIVQSFLRVYPEANALLATHSLDTPVLGLVAWPGRAGVSRSALRDRLARLEHAARLPALHLEDELAVLGSFVAGPRALQQFAAEAPLNTDDRPVVARRAPYATYAPELAPHERLLELLRLVQVAPGDVLAPADPEDRAFDARLGAYWAARDRFIALGATVQPSSGARQMLAQVGAPLLAILRASPDFRPAYDPLLNLARALAASDPALAQGLLSELASAQPARPDALSWLERLANGPAAARLR
jgi:spermidine synthase